MEAPQEPPAAHRDGGWAGGWDRHQDDVLPLCARGQDTCLAPTCSCLGLKTTPFLQHRRGWSCEMERYRGAMQPSGQDPPNLQLQNEKYRLSCLKHCPVLRQPAGYRCHTTPLWRGILYVRSLPCYFWLLKQQRTNILFSSAQPVQEKSASDGSAAHVPHLRPRVAPLAFGSDWWLVPRPCYQEPNGFFSMSCPLPRKLYELLG